MERASYKLRHAKYCKIVLSIALTVGGMVSSISAVRAEAFSYSMNNFGGVGLLEMRTARFAPDGDISIGGHHEGPSTRVFASWQATPWLETTLSYTDDKPDSLGVDRSLDIKVRLWEEGNYRPQVALGLQDVLGNGRYAGEYLVASKRYYDFDFTMGLGWGFLGSRWGLGNMFHLFGDGFSERDTSSASGDLRTGSYFAGQDMAFFAGVEYRTPLEGVSIKAEYSGVDRRKYDEFSSFDRKSAFNIGLNYAPTDWASLALGFDHGDRVSFRLTLRQNLHKMKLGRLFKDRKPPAIFERSKDNIVVRNMPEMAPVLSRSDDVFTRLRYLDVAIESIAQKQDRNIFHVRRIGKGRIDYLTVLGAILESYNTVTLFIADSGAAFERYDASQTDIIGRAARERYHKTVVYLREQAARQGDTGLVAAAALERLDAEKLAPLSVAIEGRKVTVVKKAGPYFNEAKNIGRTARLLTQEMPSQVEIFTLVTEKEGLPISEVSVLRRDLENAKRYQSSPEEMWANSVVQTPGHAKSDPSVPSGKSYPQMEWGIIPGMKSHFGGNEDGRFRHDLYVHLYGLVQVSRHLSLAGEIKQFITGDLDKIPLDTTPDVPKVRSDVSLYTREGRRSIERLEFNYSHALDESFFTRLSAGLLESMYGGVSAEVLYRPYTSNLAIGAELNWVKQRNYDQLFSFRDYQTLTGHVTLYHENEKYNITSKLSAGRYLAGDFGATLDISRHFKNGIRLGVWATYTDMSAEKFGAGSFDKGIYLTVPLEIFWYKPSTRDVRFDFRSLGRNGGQKLDRRQDLYDLISSGRKDRLENDWRAILD